MAGILKAFDGGIFEEEDDFSSKLWKIDRRLRAIPSGGSSCWGSFSTGKDGGVPAEEKVGVSSRIYITIHIPEYARIILLLLYVFKLSVHY